MTSSSRELVPVAPFACRSSAKSAFDLAAPDIGRPGLHPHELRHTAASLAIAAGADVKVVQPMLGHASAAMTLDRYGHLFGDRLDDVAERMASARDVAVAPLLPRSEEKHPLIRRFASHPGNPDLRRRAPGRIRTCATASGERSSGVGDVCCRWNSAVLLRSSGGWRWRRAIVSDSQRVPQPGSVVTLTSNQKAGFRHASIAEVRGGSK